jgi:hypothetical protein
VTLDRDEPRGESPLEIDETILDGSHDTGVGRGVAPVDLGVTLVQGRQKAAHFLVLLAKVFEEVVCLVDNPPKFAVLIAHSSSPLG